MVSNQLFESLSSKVVVGTIFLFLVVARQNLPIVSTADIRGSEGQASAPFCDFFVAKKQLTLQREKRKQRKVQGSNPWTWKRTVRSMKTVQIENSRHDLQDTVLASNLK